MEVLKRGASREEHFQDKILRTDAGCWEWTGKHVEDGYGYFAYREDGKSRTVLAHRFAYTNWVGPIPAGLVIDHLCRNKRCVNPDHLEAVTPSENNRRHYVLQQFCAQGHELTEDNVYRPPTRPTHRVCRTCRKAVVRQNYLRKHGKLPSE